MMLLTVTVFNLKLVDEMDVLGGKRGNGETGKGEREKGIYVCTKLNGYDMI